MEERFVFYIHSEVFNPENFSDKNFNTFAKSTNTVFEIARQLKADVFYAPNEIQELKSFFEVCATDFTQSQSSRLYTLLKDFKPFEDKYHFFKVHFAENQTSLEPVNYGFLNAMDDHKAIKIVFTQNASNKEHLLLVQASHDFYFCEINHFNQAKDIWTFINYHSPLRTYNFSPKHGNATTKAIAPKPSEKASQLLCSDLEAQTLLNSAVFDFREKKFYYNFDEIHDTYILFPYEGETPQNQFHAYHITKEEWHKEIPTSIKKHFKKS